MKVDVVVDVGNSRMKWGRCADGVVQHTVALPLDEVKAWHRQLTAWRAHAPRRWAISSVNPMRQDRLVEWLEGRGHEAIILNRYSQLPLTVQVEHPEQVGMDRLLNAVAAMTRSSGGPAVIVDAGSAVTVDLVDATGAFRGGAIFPGLRLMAQALHDHTALLPLVDLPQSIPPVLGTSTVAAIQSGIYYAVVGAVYLHTEELVHWARAWCPIFFTGGDAPLIWEYLHPRTDPDNRQIELWPQMTLDGLRIAAEAQP